MTAAGVAMLAFATYKLNMHRELMTVTQNDPTSIPDEVYAFTVGACLLGFVGAFAGSGKIKPIRSSMSASVDVHAFQRDFATFNCRASLFPQRTAMC